jgi:hypothetical protein
MINLDEKVERYIKLRDAKEEMERILKEKLEKIKDEMSLIENEILDFLNQTGQTSAKTKHGVPYKSVTKSVTVDNSDLFFEFVKQNNAFDLVQKRVVSTAFDRYLEDGIDVPGVKTDARISLKIRKS